MFGTQPEQKEKICREVGTLRVYGCTCPQSRQNLLFCRSHLAKHDNFFGAVPWAETSDCLFILFLHMISRYVPKIWTWIKDDSTGIPGSGWESWHPCYTEETPIADARFLFWAESRTQNQILNWNIVILTRKRLHVDAFLTFVPTCFWKVKKRFFPSWESGIGLQGPPCVGLWFPLHTALQRGFCSRMQHNHVNETCSCRREIVQGLGYS